MDRDGLGISRRKIRLSTAGVVTMIRRCGAELAVNLAVSLHAVRDDIRDRLVPLNRKYPIAELLEACRSYPGASNARRITFEYVMLKGVNDSPSDPRELVRLVTRIPSKLNSLPFTPPPRPLTPRGRDILAACGQLKSASVRVRRSERPPLPAA